MKCPNRLAFDEMIFEQVGTERPITVVDNAPTVSTMLNETWDEVSIYYLVALKCFCLLPHIH